MKKTFAKITLLLLAAGAFFFAGLRFWPGTPSGPAAVQAYAAQDTQPPAVEADGVVRANQSALLTWRSSGVVDRIQVSANQAVSAGQELASLDPASLPNNVILAQANLISAQKALDELADSNLQRARAEKAVEDAQQALDDLLHPDTAQAQALEEVASAQEALDQAELQVYILTTPPAQTVVEQAHANLLMAEKKVDNTHAQLERVHKQQQKLTRLPPAVRGSVRASLKKGVDGLEAQLNRDQIRLDEVTQKYNDLLAPADPSDVAVAELDLAVARARLAQAQGAYEDQKDGPSPGELAQAQARLADAQREWERLKDGADPADIAAAQARVAAAQAVLGQARLTAPFAGMITRLEAQPGDRVKPGDLAFRLDDLSSLYVDVQVSEIDVNRVHVGQSADLVFDGIPGREYHGTVVAVAPVGAVSQGAGSFTTTIELSDADQAVRPGMTVTAHIQRFIKLGEFVK